MNKKLVLTSIIAATLLISGGIWYFNSQNNAKEETLSIGINTSDEEFYKFAKKELKNQGVNLKIQSFDDYIQPNLAVGNDKLDINAFQHLPYLNTFKKENKNNLGVQKIEPLTKTIVSPLRLYSNKHKNLTQLLKQSTLKIAVPNDSTNEARALHLLESSGLIKLKKDDLTASVKDIEKTKYNIEIKEIDAAQTAKVLNEVDGSIINGNFALANNISLDKSLIIESENVYHQFDNIIAGKTKITKKSAYKKFVNFIKSDKGIQKRKEINKYDIVITDK